jgi:hypothetical protein
LRNRLWYDRDKAGDRGQKQAVDRINETGDLTAEGFDWNVTFPSPTRGRVQIPETIGDPGEFSEKQLNYLRKSQML